MKRQEEASLTTSLLRQPADGLGGRKRQPSGDRARERAMHAAMGLIAERGVGKVRMVDIAARSGMSTGHILYHFGKKERLLLEVLVWSESFVAEQYERRCARAVSPQERLEAFVDAYLPSGADDERWALWTQAFAQRLGSGEDQAIITALTDEWEERLREVIVATRAREATSAFVDAAVIRIRALLDGLSIDIVCGNPRWDSGSVREFALDAIRLDPAFAT
ncbi:MULTISPECIES: TetR/AcrR family transcriptional regulator [unclassified Mycolicibacterium]|uniref:TetR/AcrR family transcriptional regulator n=1 Tax=unclassified Mycolicibacterium TaxID=2636767 RepID=UPI002EDADFCB